MSQQLRDLQHPWFARVYERISRAAEGAGVAEHRDRLLAGLTGRVVEVGAGNGLNFAHYPGTVTEVLAVEPEDRLRGIAEGAVAEATVPVRVVAGRAEQLPVADGSCDAAVVSLVLCSVPDQHRALAEIHRILRPGGELRFYEHVRSDRMLLARAEDLVSPLWSRLAGGCHLNRDTAAAVPAAGFTVDTQDRFIFRPARFAAQAHILGRAHKHAA
ncbi:MAG: methyltransferase domain-containing protein [Pseudonocardiaceae bacterium]|nr:methyltransferase domain-containing protein [Pseudonocardiaceae bacterium]